jgi:2-iminobutanoate/2-iminopropanoate deaminase
MPKTSIVPAQTAHLPLPFSPAIITGDWVFVSGQASVDDQGAIVNGSFEEEMHRSMRNLEVVLNAAGCSLTDVVAVRAYVHDPADLAEFNALYREYFTNPLPARTTLTSCLGPIKFEIDVTARLPGSG